MLIYNTTFQVDDEVHDNFLIWIKESYIPEVEKHGVLRAPRICRVLSHRDEGTSYSLQWEVDNSSLLHRCHLIGKNTRNPNPSNGRVNGGFGSGDRQTCSHGNSDCF